MKPRIVHLLSFFFLFLLSPTLDTSIPSYRHLHIRSFMLLYPYSLWRYGAALSALTQVFGVKNLTKPRRTWSINRFSDENNLVVSQCLPASPTCCFSYKERVFGRLEVTVALIRKARPTPSGYQDLAHNRSWGAGDRYMMMLRGGRAKPLGQQSTEAPPGLAQVCRSRNLPSDVSRRRISTSTPHKPPMESSRWYPKSIKTTRATPIPTPTPTQPVCPSPRRPICSHSIASLEDPRRCRTHLWVEALRRTQEPSSGSLPVVATLSLDPTRTYT